MSEGTTTTETVTEALEDGTTVTVTTTVAKPAPKVSRETGSVQYAHKYTRMATPKYISYFFSSTKKPYFPNICVEDFKVYLFLRNQVENSTSVWTCRSAALIYTCLHAW